ncbi:TPA: hypothetical protein DCL30_03580 [Candidatus Peribacteria bacterium]|nr:MAG: hypothetical protein A3J91_05910 [Candidatus Peribacteria bacterium RIFOXYC2_FULL_58_10]OGJ83900.1 MAG: hypothetical protein A2529_04060 [Candidatus Peribacteria bacterium RIFOXYD2_FULL_58_15]HAI98588.1 hypothetical protein [Candidatus Peribacteria bacterium]HAS34301.1 hypothetical protein [Candidatus Peribacteria bacterium]
MLSSSLPLYRGDVTEDGLLEPFRVAAMDNVSQEVVTRLKQTPGIALTDTPEQAQGMLIRDKSKFPDLAAFERFRALMYLIRVGVGVDNISMDAASRAGVATLNTPGASTQPVAQRALAFILSWAARLKEGTQSLQEGRWDKGRDARVEPIDLSEKTLGIVGFGRIGQTLHRLAKPLFARVLYADIRDVPVADAQRVPLEELLEQSHIVSIHTADTTLTPELLARMRDDGLLVNTARGKAVSKEGLLAKMHGGLSYGSDVFWDEKKGDDMFKDEPTRLIVKQDRFAGTPHTAADDRVTKARLGREAAQRMTDFALHGIVNPDSIPGHTVPKIDAGVRSKPGYRFVLTHASVKQQLQRATTELGERGFNIQNFHNAEEDRNGNPHKLAMTSFDLGADTGRENARGVLDTIAQEVGAYKKRLMFFGS